MSKDKTLRGAAHRYVEDSSTGGVRRVARPGVVTRVVWVSVISACAAMTIYSLVRLRAVRSERRASMASRHDDARSMIFPDVTICGVYPLKQSVLLGREFAALTNQTAWQELLFAPDSQHPKNSRSESENRALRHQYQTLLDQLTQKQQTTAGHNLTDLLVDCTLGDAPCNSTNFTRFHDHKYGNCYTFTPNPSLHAIWATGKEHGMMMEVNTQTVKERTKEEAGVIVAVHESRDTVFLPERAVFVPESFTAWLSLSKETEILPSNCLEEGDASYNLYSADTDWSYSQTGCQHGCLQKRLVGLCGCCDLDLLCPSSFLPSSSSSSHVAAPRCNTDAELTCRRGVLQSYMDGSLPCLSDCLPRCRQTRFNTRLSMTTKADTTTTAINGDLPTARENLEPSKQQSASVSQKALSTKSPLDQQLEAQQEPVAAQPSLSRRRKRQTECMYSMTCKMSTIRIYVYFEDLRTRITETVDTVDWSEWMADVGGMLSLWMGLSVLGMVEMVHLMVELLYLGLSKVFSMPGPTVVKPIDP